MGGIWRFRVAFNITCHHSAILNKCWYPFLILMLFLIFFQYWTLERSKAQTLSVYAIARKLTKWKTNRKTWKLQLGKNHSQTNKRESRGRPQAMEIRAAGTGLCCLGREGFMCSGWNPYCAWATGPELRCQRCVTSGSWSRRWMANAQWFLRVFQHSTMAIQASLGKNWCLNTTVDFCSLQSLRNA